MVQPLLIVVTLSVSHTAIYILTNEDFFKKIKYKIRKKSIAESLLTAFQF